MKIRICSENHKHQGEKVAPGTVLEVDEPTGKHLIALGAAEAIPADKAKKE
jgi:hypothetical protein